MSNLSQRLAAPRVGVSDSIPAWCRKAADRGAKLLDLQRPGWYQEVDVGELNIMTRETCMLGQLYGDYFTGKAILNIDVVEASRLGFVASVSECFLAIFFRRRSKLDMAWKIEVDKRLATA